MAKEVDEGADASCCCCCDVDGGGAEVASSWVYVVVAADGAMGIEALVLGLDLSRGRLVSSTHWAVDISRRRLTGSTRSGHGSGRWHQRCSTLV